MLESGVGGDELDGSDGGAAARRVELLGPVDGSVESVFDSATSLGESIRLHLLVY